MQIEGKYAWFKHLDFMIVDMAALFLSFAAAYSLKFGDAGFLSNEAWMRLLLVVLLLNMLITFFINPYSGILRRAYYEEIVKALQLTVSNFLIASVFFFVLKIGARYSREVVLLTYGFYPALSLVMKYVWKKLLLSRKIVLDTTREKPLFIVSDGAHIGQTLENVSAGDFRLYSVRGIHLIDGGETPPACEGLMVRENFVQWVLDQNINDVLIAVPPSAIPTEECERLNANGVSVHIDIELAVGFQTENQCISNLGVCKTLNVGTFSFTPGQLIYLKCKRAVDILGGLVWLALLLPAGLLVKIAALFSGDTAPIFYRQERIGREGKEIKILKFRSMVPDAGEILQELLKDEKYRREWDENQKLSHDPRITKIGRFLRRTSLDELPQVVNVLRGDMSLIGPRPLVRGELEAHGGLKLYERVRPGITGWWGCNGRSNIGYRERLELEYYYVKHCSFYLDTLCLFRSFFAILKKDGAQ